MMCTPKACPVWGRKSTGPVRFAAVFDRSVGRWRGASLLVVPGSRVLIMSFAPPVTPGAFCDPRAAWESRAAAVRAVSK